MFTIKLHPILYILLFLSGLTGKISGFVLAFLSVLLHETAHLLTALGFGYQTFAIELFPFGGVARMDYSLFNDPIAEALTALAGPLESIIFAMLIKVFSPFLQLPKITEDLFTINLGLAFVNILPLFPLDGGRIIRSFLAGKGGYKKATIKVTRFTKLVVLVSGIPLIYLSLRGVVPLHFPFLLLFLFFSAREDNFLYAYLAQKDKKTTVLEKKGLLSSKVWVVEPGKKIGEIIPFLTGKNYHLFFLTDKHGKIVGEVTEEQLVLSLNQENSLHTNFYQILVRQDKSKLGE
ncbi:MAG TPA: hypothetical protein DDZ91_04250 [Firmicutes bacterium]|jgi:stage IV sporulation protein FB|nr:hypothetical protein [Bacillota bacterium]